MSIPTRDHSAGSSLRCPFYRRANWGSARLVNCQVTTLAVRIHTGIQWLLHEQQLLGLILTWGGAEKYPKHSLTPFPSGRCSGIHIPPQEKWCMAQHCRWAQTEPRRGVWGQAACSVRRLWLRPEPPQSFESLNELLPRVDLNFFKFYCGKIYLT